MGTVNLDCRLSDVNSSSLLDPLPCQYCIRPFPLTGETASLANILSAMLLVSCRDCIKLPSMLSGTEETSVGATGLELTEASRGLSHDVSPHAPISVHRTEKPYLLKDFFGFYFPRLYWGTIGLSLSGYTVDLYRL